MHEHEKTKLDLSQKYLNFKLADEKFAIPLSIVREVIAPLSLTEVPNYPSYYKGIIDLRGVIIPVIDLKLKMKISKQSKSNKESAFIIINIDDQPFGIITDTVDCVLEFKADEIKEPPTNLDSSQLDYVSGVVNIDNSLVLTLDLNQLIKINKNQALNKAA